MHIERPQYLEKLKKKRKNGMIKVITGIRRCGKSYLLKNIYHDYLLSDGVDENHIIVLDLDEIGNAQYRNPFNMDEYIRSKIVDKDMYYVFIDEIQKCSAVVNPYIKDHEEKITFVDTILGLQKLHNVDLYVTGSNSSMLSSDVLSMFRGRSDEINVSPLSYKEFYTAYTGDKRYAWRDYWRYGGMPYVMTLSDHNDKSHYLQDLFTNIYIKDILERYNIHNDVIVLEDLLNYLSSSVGSLTNPSKLSKTFASEKQIKISSTTISKYLNCFEDSFLIKKVNRFDVKGRKYISTPVKYYFNDIGLRNARLNFRQTEENHIMENIIYNELIHRGYNVDVGVVELNGKDAQKRSFRKQLEIDFIVNDVDKRYYIQCALHLDTEEKRNQVMASLSHVNDSFKKIIIQKGDFVPWYDENGILNISVEDFLLEDYL